MTILVDWIFAMISSILLKLKYNWELFGNMDKKSIIFFENMDNSILNKNYNGLCY